MNNKFSKILFIFALSLSAMPVFATELNLKSGETKFDMVEKFQVDLILNTENDFVNAMEGKILFPISLAELKEIKEGGSIINFWVEKPKAGELGVISFSGITPGGYRGEKGLIFSLIFEAKKSGVGAIDFKDVKILRNDGAGTLINAKISPLKFFITKNIFSGEQKVGEIADTELPENFSIEISKNSEMFDEKWFIVFGTQDKGSGIDHYEVCEGNLESCVPAESPFLLSKQTLIHKIFVKAIDKKGNVRMAEISPDLRNNLITIFIIFGLIIIVWFLYKRKEYEKK